MRRATRGAIILLAGASLLATQGCYRRVVRTSGFGASTTPVYEGNTKVPKGTKNSNTALSRPAKYDY
jgi:hypothetical protein